MINQAASTTDHTGTADTTADDGDLEEPPG